MAKTITGTVVSNKTDQTIVIKTHSRKTHPIYKKQYPVSKKFMADDPKNSAKIGDLVMIEECRPLSARKRFRLVKILETALLTQESLTAIKSEDLPKVKKTKEEE